MSVAEIPSDHSGHAITGQVGVMARKAGTGKRWLRGYTLPKQRLRRLASVFQLPLADAVALSALVGHAMLPVLPGTAYVLVVLTVLITEGQHRVRICLRLADQLPRIAVAAALPLIMLVPWTGTEDGALVGLCAAASLAGLRAIVYGLLRSAHRHGRLLEPALIVGSDPLAAQICRLLAEHPELGLRPRGQLDRMGRDADSPLSVLGDPLELAEIVRHHRIGRVIVCVPAIPDEEMVTVLRECRPLTADVCMVPKLPELGMAIPRSTLDEIWGIPLIPLRRFGHPQASAAVKRGFDLAAGTALLVVLSPLLIALAIAVRMGSGTVFFRQLRVSRRTGSTRVVKFRTVASGAEDRWSVEAHQCTRLGRWLRSTHLDELPQLFNVLRGDMSLVGPRPERPKYAVRFARQIPLYDDRHRMPAGMTGWAQVHGLHGDTSIPDRARFDNQYIEYWSPWLDLVIVIRTIAIVLSAAARSPAAIRIASGGDQGEGSACDHGSRRRRRRTAAALDPPAHPS